MITYQVDFLKEGMLVAENAYSSNGQLIVKAGSILNRQMLSHLKLYQVDEVAVEEGEPPEETKRFEALAAEVEATRIKRLTSGPQYQEFLSHYEKELTIVERSLNCIILKNADIDEGSLIQEATRLMNKDDTAFELIGMLHYMKQIDDSTYAHSINVGIIARLLGGWLDYSKEDCDQLTLAGILHDIGKCQIPEDILFKPGKLSKMEFEFMKKHPEFGYKLIEDKPLDDRVKQAVLFHHERCDGTGYPIGLSGDQISEFVSIISVADVYDAMTSARCYRGALCPFEVIASFEGEGLSKYQPRVIITFLQKIANSFLNSDVLLSDSRVATIVFINQRLARPIVRFQDGNFLNLEEHPDLYIESII